jgi:hypothetical protein
MKVHFLEYNGILAAKNIIVDWENIIGIIFTSQGLVIRNQAQTLAIIEQSNSGLETLNDAMY